MPFRTIDIFNITDNNQDVQISSTDLAILWQDTFPEASFSAVSNERVFIQAFEYYTGLTAQDKNLELGKGWVLNIKAGLVKAALAGSFLSTLLYIGGISDIPTIVLPVIIPFLFEISRIKLTKKEEVLYAELRRTPEATAKWHSSEELYKLLPADAQKSINFYDFHDFIEKISDVGLLKKSTNQLIKLSENAFFTVKID